MTVLFDFSSFPTLTTERLCLRQMTPDDADAIVDLFGDPEVLRFLNIVPTQTRESALELIDWLNRDYSGHNGVTWAMTLHEKDRLIGTCGWYDWVEPTGASISVITSPALTADRVTRRRRLAP